MNTAILGFLTSRQILPAEILWDSSDLKISYKLHKDPRRSQRILNERWTCGNPPEVSQNPGILTIPGAPHSRILWKWSLQHRPMKLEKSITFSRIAISNDPQRSSAILSDPQRSSAILSMNLRPSEATSIDNSRIIKKNETLFWCDVKDR